MTATDMATRRSQLRTMEQRYRMATERAENARADRNDAIRAALADGWTHAQIAEAMGLTRGRIGQLAN